MKKYSLSEIKSYYSDVKKKQDSQLPFYHRKFIRPFSFYITIPFLFVGASANIVTYLSFLIGLIGNLFLTQSQSYPLIVGILLIHFSILLDFVDGNIARYNNTNNHFGKFIDGVLGQIIYGLIPFSLGIGVSQSSLQINYFNITPIFAIILGSCASISMLLSACIRWRYRYSLTEVFKNKKNDKHNIDPVLNNKQSMFKLIWRKLYNITDSISNIILPLLLLVYLDLSAEILLVFCFVSFASSLLTHVKLLFQASKTLNYKRDF